MDLKLGGRSVLVTGASKGIGLAVANWFAAEGCNLHLCARSADDLDAAARDIRGRHAVEVTPHAFDLASLEGRSGLVGACPEVDIVVNNAGAIPGGGIDDVSDAAWRAGWELKLFGFIDLTRAYYQAMRERRRGVIINIIGAAGERATYDYIAGCTGNAALMSFTRTIGGRSPDFGVRVLGVNPGPVATDRITGLYRARAKAALGSEDRFADLYARMPFGRPATPDEIAASVVFLASDLSAYTSGTIVTIDGGKANRG